MKHIAVILMLVALMIFLVPQVACTSPPTPDPDNGVSNASYRLVVTQGYKNLCDLWKRIVAAEAKDQASLNPVHSKDWWDAQAQNVSATASLFGATLKGATYTASPQ